MNHKNKILLSVLLLFVAHTSTQTISINHELKLEEGTKVDWAITVGDSILDFRSGQQRYAEILNDSLLCKNSTDSVIAILLTEVKTIHTFKKASKLTSSISVLAIIVFVMSYYFFGGLNLSM